jgi:hypothetical protein
MPAAGWICPHRFNVYCSLFLLWFFGAPLNSGMLTILSSWAVLCYDTSLASHHFVAKRSCLHAYNLSFLNFLENFSWHFFSICHCTTHFFCTWCPQVVKDCGTCEPFVHLYCVTLILYGFTDSVHYVERTVVVRFCEVHFHITHVMTPCFTKLKCFMPYL